MRIAAALFPVLFVLNACIEGPPSPPDRAEGEGEGEGEGALGPLRVENLSVTLQRVDFCLAPDNSSLDCGDYRLTFVLRNAADVAVNRLEFVTIESGNIGGTASTFCSEFPWTLEPGSSTAPIDIDFHQGDQNRTHEPEIFLPCGGSTVRIDVDPVADPFDPPPALRSGSMTLRLDAIFEDASRFEAQATGQIVDRSRQ